MAVTGGLFIPKQVPVFLRTKGLHSGDALNGISGLIGSFQQVIATGTLQTDAANINTSNVEVLSGSASNAGIILPPAYPGLSVNILNNSLNTTKVYPNGTEQIQNAGTTYGAASAAVSIVTLVSWRLFCIKAGFWQRVITS